MTSSKDIAIGHCQTLLELLEKCPEDNPRIEDILSGLNLFINHLQEKLLPIDYGRKKAVKE